MTATELKELLEPFGVLRYELQRTGRRRTVAITVEPDRRVVVLAPMAADPLRIEQIVRRRLPWIRRQRQTLERLPQPVGPRQWIAGETHRYLGRQYRLKPIRGPDRSVKLVSGHFVVTVPDPHDRRGIQRLMESWYRERAECVLSERVRRALASTTWLGVQEPPIAIRVMRQRWGSTTARGRIYFNIEAIKLPLGCLDYVVAHELVHLRIPNHGPAFWRMLARCQPDWRRWRERLGRVEI